MELTPPADLFGREREWASLARWIADPTPGLQVALVYGRRRQGKSFLLRRLARASGGFYHQAIQHEPAQALAELGEDLGAHLGVGRLALASWSEALTLLAGLGDRARAKPARGPAVVVLDEFPYLYTSSRELPSVIQRAVDRSLDEASAPVRLILCGSALSVMSELVGASAPLHGRIHAQVVLSPFDYRGARDFWGVDDPALALALYAVVGGTPGYRDLARGRPASLADFDEWVVERVLDPTSALFREDEVLLAETPDLVNRALYLSILSAVADGNVTQSAIAAAVGRGTSSIQHALESLERTGFVDKDDDVVRQRRPYYAIAEPLVRFHQAIRHRDAARFEDGDGRAAWRDARARFSSGILGPTWEGVVREYVRRFAPEGLVGDVARVGRTHVANPDARADQEVDVVVVGRGSGPAGGRVRALGEATMREMAPRDLVRLEDTRARLARRAPRAALARLILASATGHESSLVAAAAARDDVALLGLADLYGER